MSAPSLTGPEPRGLVWGASTHRGLHRLTNEDAYVAGGSVYLVADGMGGHDAGELASAAAVAEFRGLLDHEGVAADELRDGVARAQSAVRAVETSSGHGAGTTLTGVVVAEQDGRPVWLVVNVGDSRTYQLSGRTLDQVTVDHSEVQELVDSGTISRDQAITHPRRNVVTRALGSWPAPEPDLWFVPMVVGDRLLVCSDGLSGEVPDSRLAELLLAEPDPQRAADRLVEEALDAGGRDNITVIVIDVAGPAPGIMGA